MRRVLLAAALSGLLVCVAMSIRQPVTGHAQDDPADSKVITIGKTHLSSALVQTDIPGPAGSGGFGTQVVLLPNGNFVVTDLLYDDGINADVGAVHLYNGTTLTLISTLKGSTANDMVTIFSFPQITVLANGDFVVSNPTWDGPGAVNAGAATLCNAVTGCSGTISSANSLVGSFIDDVIGSRGVAALTNGNYVVGSHGWANGILSNAGAATFCNGNSGCVGPVSIANSLVGDDPIDTIAGNGITPLPNGNYVVKSPAWTNNPNMSVGAATFCSGTTGCTGLVSQANSLVGSIEGRVVGSAVTALSNGNYLVRSGEWDSVPTASPKGAVTFCSGTTGCSGIVSAANSLVGLSLGDRIGGDNRDRITELSNGNYLVHSPNWDNPSPVRADVGAVTFCSGATGCTGPVNSANSLIGSTANDKLGTAQVAEHTPVAALTNGNYVVGLASWPNAGLIGVGAAAFCNGTTGCVGEIVAVNSLVGTIAGDNVGFRVAALTNGNYVVGSQGWDNGIVNGNFGAATLCSGTAGCVGTVSSVNSFIGAQTNDGIGRGITPLSNGNYVLNNSEWRIGVNNVGATTFCNGVTGCTGTISAANSLTGSTTSDAIGESGSLNGTVALPNGNYIVLSRLWNNTAPVIADAGAITFCNGTTGCAGMTVSSTNSLVGSSANDGIGSDQFGNYLTVYSNNRYIAQSPVWDNGVPIPNAGAVTLGNGISGTTGVINSANSVLGTVTNGISPNPGFAYNVIRDCVYVGRSASNIVTVFCGELFRRSLFDYDGDGRTDASVFRPATNEWHIAQSSGGIRVQGWGIAGDRMAPADFDGDGKTDIAVFRPSEGNWYVVNSSNNTVTVAGWGNATDQLVPGDYNGDGKADFVIYRPSEGRWYRRDSDGQVHVWDWGLGGDKPAPADFDGDGRLDLTVFRPSEGRWYTIRSSDFVITATDWGVSGDVPVAADYSGDGKADFVVFRPSDLTWYRRHTDDNSLHFITWGLAGDFPVPGDYDGDGKTDLAVFRPVNGTWFIFGSQAGIYQQSFGLQNDLPTPNAFVY